MIHQITHENQMTFIEQNSKALATSGLEIGDYLSDEELAQLN